MKKIHITEEQFNDLKKKIAEAVTVDATSEVENSGGNIKTAWNNMKSKNPMLGQQAGSGEITLGVNPEGVDEGKFFTKKQIQEAKLANLKKNCKVYKKGEVR